MKKYFIVTDVHSFYKIMLDTLNVKGFDVNNNEHYLILCGDLNTSLKIFQQTACKCMQFFLKGVLQAKCLCNTFQENREFFFAIQKEFYSFPMLIPRFFLLHAAGML